MNTVYYFLGVGLSLYQASKDHKIFSSDMAECCLPSDNNKLPTTDLQYFGFIFQDWYLQNLTGLSSTWTSYNSNSYNLI